MNYTLLAYNIVRNEHPLLTQLMWEQRRTFADTKHRRCINSNVNNPFSTVTLNVLITLMPNTYNNRIPKSNTITIASIINIKWNTQYYIWHL